MTAQEIYDKIMKRHYKIIKKNHERNLYFIKPIEENSVPDEIWYWAKPDKQLANEVLGLFEKKEDKTK